jgi:hypothetical protein
VADGVTLRGVCITPNRWNEQIVVERPVDMEEK